MSLPLSLTFAYRSVLRAAREDRGDSGGSSRRGKKEKEH